MPRQLGRRADALVPAAPAKWRAFGRHTCRRWNSQDTEDHAQHRFRASHGSGQDRVVERYRAQLQATIRKGVGLSPNVETTIPAEKFVPNRCPRRRATLPRQLSGMAYGRGVTLQPRGRRLHPPPNTQLTSTYRGAPPTIPLFRALRGVAPNRLTVGLR